MSQHKIHVFSGQVRMIHDFFKDYQDENEKVTIDQLNKIDVVMTVETDMTGKETEN